MNDHIHPIMAKVLSPWAPPVSNRIRTTLEWIPTLEECPAPGDVVMASVAGEKYALPAFFDGMTWCHVSGHEINGEVTHYAERPMGLAP